MNTRTEYRKMRHSFLNEIVVLLFKMSEMKEKDLEMIPLTFFKKLQKTIENRAFE